VLANKLWLTKYNNMNNRFVKIIKVNRLNNSVNWNPKYSLVMEDLLFMKTTIEASTASDAWWVYWIVFNSLVNKEINITTHTTKGGKIIIDKMTF